MNVFAHINLAALHHNLAQVRKLAPASRIMAMVKGDGYGHGLMTIAKSLEDHVEALGVARIEEALMLREAGIKGSIVLMEGFTRTDELPLLVKHDLATVVHQVWQVEALETSGLNHCVDVWLKIDTGMHRLGFSPEDVLVMWQRLHRCRAVNSTLGLMTHFACADDPNSPYNELQIACFEAVTADLLGHRSMANSAAIMEFPSTHQDWVRPGIMLYGISPFMGTSGQDRGLRPVMTLYSEIIAIRQAKQGEYVGYGATWCCPKDTTIGVIAMGYGDGYPRYIRNGAPVRIGEQTVSLVGRVSMDMITVDLADCPEARVGAPVILWGDRLPVEEIAAWANTSPYELLCGVTSRVKRVVYA